MDFITGNNSNCSQKLFSEIWVFMGEKKQYTKLKQQITNINCKTCYRNEMHRNLYKIMQGLYKSVEWNAKEIAILAKL